MEIPGRCSRCLRDGRRVVSPPRWQRRRQYYASGTCPNIGALREPDIAAGAAQDELPATLEMDTESALITRLRDRYAAVQELISSGCGYGPAARQLGLVAQHGETLCTGGQCR